MPTLAPCFAPPWALSNAHVRSLLQSTNLGQAVEHPDDALSVDGHGNSGIQAVRRQLVLVHKLRPSHRLSNGYQEVVSLRMAWLKTNAPEFLV